MLQVSDDGDPKSIYGASNAIDGKDIYQCLRWVLGGAAPAVYDWHLGGLCRGPQRVRVRMPYAYCIAVIAQHPDFVLQRLDPRHRRGIARFRYGDCGCPEAQGSHFEADSCAKRRLEER